jgi:hypothetical protein
MISKLLLPVMHCCAVTLFLAGCGHKEYHCYADGHADCKGASKVCTPIKDMCKKQVRKLGMPTFDQPAFKKLPKADQQKRKKTVLAEDDVEKKPPNKLDFDSSAVKKFKGSSVLGWLLPLLGGLLVLGGIGALVYFLCCGKEDDGDDDAQDHADGARGAMQSPDAHSQNVGAQGPAGGRADSPRQAESDWQPITRNGKTFYYNKKTGQSSWTKPEEHASAAADSLPEGWQSSQSNGRTFYYNRSTGQTSWTKP